MDNFLDDLARRIGRIVAEELRGGDPSLVEQASSPLGSRRHCAAVKRRIAEGRTGASIVGRRHLLTQEALAEELGRKKGPGLAKTGTSGPRTGDGPAGAELAMLEKLRLVRGS